LANELSSLIGPRTGDVAHCVTTASKDQGRKVEALDVLHAVSVTTHGQVEATKTITTQRVTTALQNDSIRAEELHDFGDDGFEDTLVCDIVHTITKREVDSVVFAIADTDVAQFTSTREVLSVLVEGAGHDAIGRVEGFFNTITMVNVDIDVENARLESEELDDSENNVVDVTETTGFALFCVM
jgi:hypothetical protein